MKTAIVNIATIVTGDWRKPFAKGDSILMDKGRIKKVGTLSAKEINACDVVVDANRTTACPGLIDSQVHITFGDYTPRRRWYCTHCWRGPGNYRHRYCPGTACS